MGFVALPFSPPVFGLWCLLLWLSRFNSLAILLHLYRIGSAPSPPESFLALGSALRCGQIRGWLHTHLSDRPGGIEDIQLLARGIFMIVLSTTEYASSLAVWSPLPLSSVVS
eukprot:c32876_g1_i1 orf=62-397(-)